MSISIFEPMFDICFILVSYFEYLKVKYLIKKFKLFNLMNTIDLDLDSIARQQAPKMQCEQYRTRTLPFRSLGRSNVERFHEPPSRFNNLFILFRLISKRLRPIWIIGQFKRNNPLFKQHFRQ